MGNVGWAYWQFKYYADLTTSASAGTGNEGFYNNDGSLQTWKVKALARSYMMATQGEPALSGTTFNSDTSAFSATYTVNGKAPASKQYTVDVTDPQRLTIQFTDKSLNGKVVKLAVVAKSSSKSTEFTQ